MANSCLYYLWKRLVVKFNLHLKKLTELKPLLPNSSMESKDGHLLRLTNWGAGL